MVGRPTGSRAAVFVAVPGTTASTADKLELLPLSQLRPLVPAIVGDSQCIIVKGDALL